MGELAFTLGVFGGSLLAGLLGSLTGLGGGVVLVPLLVLAFKVDLHHALGASLVSVVATSSGAAAAYVREGYINLRLGMFLETATTLGALLGANLLGVLPKRWVAVLFGLVLLHSAYLSFRSRHQDQPLPPTASHPLTARLRLGGRYPTPRGEVAYGVRRLPQGFLLMVLAGALSGLLGIGSGALKVLAMDRVMGLPYKVSTTTSNFMIGVTAAASAGLYFRRGYVDPWVAFPVVLGVLLGAFLGARLLPGTPTPRLRLVFALAIAALGVQMLVQGVRA
ncbi:sulfite exporter TauE/SafE family protein [Thermus thalpophilus]|uniref:sulfite exporter TauE/SafE family protein n=1 Tax=Thermus thalpophilus TaxID=2908147 RepID=UPI001FAB23E7|nr:sulfite exporter TauE/SafE family protein [Thermus thalpophilus]